MHEIQYIFMPTEAKTNISNLASSQQGLLSVPVVSGFAVVA